jgi:hypothetical protein
MSIYFQRGYLRGVSPLFFFFFHLSFEGEVDIGGEDEKTS